MLDDPVLDTALAPAPTASMNVPGNAIVEAARVIADGPLASVVHACDRDGFYPRAVLQEFGRAGALSAHLDLPGRPADHGVAIAAMREAARVCGATGFMIWCHAVCGLYMQASGNRALNGDMLARHADGSTLGGTGMSNPMKTFAGIETMLLKAKRTGNGYIVNGNLPWVSNLGPDHYFGAVCAVLDADGMPAAGHEVMFMVRCDAPGVSLRECPSFSAMEGTGTYAIVLKDHVIGANDIIADPVRPFIGRIKGAFILLQTGMGLGVTQGAIDSIWSVEQQLGGVNAYLEDRPDMLQEELDELTACIMLLAKTPFDASDSYLRRVLDARAHASELALRAAQSALLHQGARGYLMSSEVQRRVRESHFVAIVTPALKHLRKELARLNAPLMPA
ncbi:MAG: acyl-CoA dehydrogenase family protein [Burkholderiaceae bacterium]